MSGGPRWWSVWPSVPAPRVPQRCSSSRSTPRSPCTIGSLRSRPTRSRRWRAAGGRDGTRGAAGEDERRAAPTGHTDKGTALESLAAATDGPVMFLGGRRGRSVRVRCARPLGVARSCRGAGGGRGRRDLARAAHWADLVVSGPDRAVALLVQLAEGESRPRRADPSASPQACGVRPAPAAPPPVPLDRRSCGRAPPPIAAAVPTRSNGFTRSAAAASSAAAPASVDSTSCPSRSLTDGPSLATRLSPSRTG